MVYLVMKEKYAYTIKSVSQLTGLNRHSIRKWEQRYGAVTPHRTETNRRVYSDSDIERLKLLKSVTDRGYAIGNAVLMDNEELRSLVNTAPAPERIGAGSLSDDKLLNDTRYHYNLCIQAVVELNPKALRASLFRAENLLSRQVLIEEVIIPLLQSIGTMWEEKIISVAQEHAATAVIRTYIGNYIASVDVPDNSPRIVATAPSGQRHEIGAIIAALTAGTEGWDVIYLGADVPSRDIVSTAISRKASIIAVSLVYPENDTRTRKELTEIVSERDENQYVIAGGRASKSYSDLLKGPKCWIIDDYREFRIFLRSVKEELTSRQV